MGGKTKQSQRTKNNARPSSSGRSAELLSNVKLDSGIVNIAGTQLPALFPSLVAPTIDPQISPELQIVLKKLNKKDPITKAKALQELSELVANSDVEQVVAALPSWAHFYKILTADPDRRVRECTQACHGVLVGACGRRAAPMLRQLAPAWLQAQYDEHAPAQAHARRSLQKTFPDNKLPEVLSFCKEEIMAHFLDILVDNGVAAHVRQTDSAEERARQAERAAAVALDGLQYFVRHVPRQHLAWLWARAARLLAAPAFWQRAASGDDRTRAAWYGALAALAAHVPGPLSAACGARALRTLLRAREAAAPAASAAPLWECLLTFMHHVQDWHRYLEDKDLLIKRILDLLENGGWGDARQLSQMVLPLLAALPPALLTRDFYVAFFDSMFVGLDNKSILSSKSERQSWLASLAECLRYLSIQEHEYVLEVVTSVHRTWLEKVLAAEGQTRTHLIRSSAQVMADLVKYWLKRAQEGNNEKYDQLIRNFWQNVGSTLTSQVDRLPLDPDAISALMDAHVLLLQTLKTSFTQEPKKKRSIKFEADPREHEERPAAPPPTDPAIVERYHHNLEELVRAVCGRYLEFANEKEIFEPVLSPLITLLVVFESEALFVGMARHFGLESVYGLYEGVLRHWLAAAAAVAPRRAAVDVVFMILKYLSEEQQDAVFHSFEQFPPEVVEWCMWVCVSHPHRARAAARRWLRGAAAARALAAAAARQRDGDERARELLMLCLTPDDHGESLVSSQAVQAALQQASAALHELAAPALEARAACACALAAALPPHAPLLTALLALTASLPCGDERLSADTWREAREAWQEGAAALEPAPRETFLRDAVSLLHARARLRSNLSNTLPALAGSPAESGECSEDVDVATLEHVVSLCPGLLRAAGGPAGGGPEAAVAFTKTAFDIMPADPLKVEAFATRHEVLAGLSCPHEDDDVTTAIIQETLPELSKDDLIAFANECLFRAMYLRAVLRPPLLAQPYLQHQLCRTVHDAVIFESLHDGYAFWPHYKLIQKTKVKLCALLDDIIKEISIEDKRNILNCLSELAATKGFFWSYARRYFEVEVKLDVSENETESTNSGAAESNQRDGETEIGNSQIEEESVKIKPESNEIEADLTSEIKSDKVSVADSNGAAKANDVKEEILIKDWSSVVTGSGFFHTLQANTRKRAVDEESLRTKLYVAVRALRAAHAAEPAVTAALGGGGDEGGDLLVNTYYAHNHTMLYDMDISDAPWAQVGSNSSACGYLAARVAAHGWALPAHQWDFTNITLCSLLASVDLSKHNWGTTKVALLAASALRLFAAVAPFVAAVPARCERQAPAPHVAALPAEWADIYAPALHAALFSLLLHVLESSAEATLRSSHVAVIAALMECLPHLRWDSLGGQRARFPLARLVAAGAGALRLPGHPAFKYLAYRLLGAVHRPLVLQDAEALASWAATEAAEGAPEAAPGAAPRLTLEYYHEPLCHLQQLVDAALANVRVCEEVSSLQARTDAHALALGYLLLAEALAQQCALARGDLKHHYIHYYRERKYTEGVLCAALRLLPAPLLREARAPPSPRPDPPHARHFTRDLDTDVYAWCGAGAVRRAACRAVFRAVRGAGCGCTRGWRGAARHTHAAALDYLTGRYITPHVVKEEFTLLQKRMSEIEDSEVTISWGAQEVRCALTVDDKTVWLTLTLARQHPLTLPDVAVSHAALPSGNWLRMYLSYQNGSVLNALKMWVASVNKKMDRAPRCYICYCRLHHATAHLPGAACRTCGNKFHSVCLRTWFNTSNKRTCPLCRNTF